MTQSLAALALSLALVAPAMGQDEAPRLAGSEVPAPKRTRFVMPEYPAEAVSLGLRGIVILELVIGVDGKVVSVEVLRSVPPFDEPAAAAARGWEYEPTEVGGRPVQVRLTVPITFALKLPEMTRDDGIPELRQGASPVIPSDATGGGEAVAEVTLGPGGEVAEARIVGGTPPWTESLFTAIRTWQFVAESGPSFELSFRVKARFLPGKGSEPGRVELKLEDPQRQPVRASQPPEPAVPGGEPAETAPAPEPTAEASADPIGPSAEADAPIGDTESAAPAETATGSDAESEAGQAPDAEAEAEVDAPDSTTPGDPKPGATREPAPPSDEPPVEIVGGGPVAPQVTRLREPGVSSIPGVSLGPGVPDLVSGRRPVVPPIARMAGLSGQVEVRFSVDPGGEAHVQATNGPEQLTLAAEASVSSWRFQRRTAERLYLVAVFRYENDVASASVEPQR